MHAAAAALSRDVLDVEFPDSGFPGPANVLIMPSVDAANISYNLLRMAAGHGVTVGGIPRKPRKASSYSDPLSDRSAHCQR